MKWTQKLGSRLGWDLLPKPLRRIIVGVIGGTIVLIGILLLVLPGPAFIVIPLGLLILGTEFAWARWLVRRGKQTVRTAKQKWDDVVGSVRQP